MARPKNIATEEKASLQEEGGIERFDVIDGFVLENADKLERVVFGEVKRAGYPEGGLGENADPALVLAHYDKLAGYITKDVGGNRRVKIKTGSFWNFKKHEPHKEPQVLYLFPVNGTVVEVDDPSKLAQAVTTVNMAIAEKEAKNQERRERARRKSLIKGE